MCSCASAASASRAATARTLLSGPAPETHTAGGRDKVTRSTQSGERFVEGHREGHPRVQGFRRLVIHDLGLQPIVYAVCTQREDKRATQRVPLPSAQPR